MKISDSQKNIIAVAAIFLLALLCRCLIRQDLVNEVKVFQYGLFEVYSLTAKIINEDGICSLLDARARTANIDFLGHPIGFPLYLAAIYRVFGESENTVQVFSIFFDSLSAIVIFLTARKLFSLNIAVITGVSAALNSSFAVNSVLLLPDTLAVLPILFAVYFLVCASRRPHFYWFALAGFAFGVSCWFRSNSFFLPMFAAAFIFFIFERPRRLPYAATLFLSAYLTIFPITLRNFIVYHKFIPISLGAGQTLLEGIGDYDPERIFNVPRSDYEVSRTEADRFNRPDYAETLFGIDGIERDRRRTLEAAAFIGEHPFWFTKIYLRRSLSMLNLPKPQPISAGLPVTNFLANNYSEFLIWQQNADRISQYGQKLSADAVIFSDLPNQSFVLQTDNTRFGEQFSLTADRMDANRQLMLDFEYLIRKGRTSVKISGAESQHNFPTSDIQLDIYHPDSQKKVQHLRIPFVTVQNEPLDIRIANASGEPFASVLEMKSLSLYDLGEAQMTWLKYPRIVLGFAQKPLTTAVIAPFALLGIFFMLTGKQKKNLVLIFLVPIYYLTVQSFFHTEPRYVLAIHYFTFLSAAVGFVGLIEAAKIRLIRKRGKLKSESNPIKCANFID